MHSTVLRGDDFEVTAGGRPAAHGELFGDVTTTSRVGVLCPSPLDGLGAATWILAAVTAFYDAYRARGGEFVAYPDFFTFQLTPPTASYSMLDIWPAHKDVAVTGEDLVDALTDRAVDTLLLPDGWRGARPLQPVQRAALERTLTAAWEYAADGRVADADLQLACDADPVIEWMGRVAASAAGAEPSGAARTGPAAPRRLEQSFRRLDPAVARARLEPLPPTGEPA